MNTSKLHSLEGCLDTFGHIMVAWCHGQVSTSFWPYCVSKCKSWCSRYPWGGKCKKRKNMGTSPNIYSFLKVSMYGNFEAKYHRSVSLFQGLIHTVSYWMLNRRFRSLTNATQASELSWEARVTLLMAVGGGSAQQPQRLMWHSGFSYL